VQVVGVEKDAAFAEQAQELLVLGEPFGPEVPYNGATVHAWSSVVLHSADAASLPQAKQRVKAYLEQQSDARVLKGDRLAFQYLTQDDAAKLVATSVAQFTTFIGGIGAVSLLVGLVGIANIMLVSVQERTREIGVMKATGATRADIVAVFLLESVAICVAGGVVGVGLGLVMGVGLTEFLRSLNPEAPPVPFVAQPEWYVAAVVLGIGVGLIAGLYPAWRAAKVSPVESLRYE
jgi:putative ABC transport system permease protein